MRASPQPERPVDLGLEHSRPYSCLAQPSVASAAASASAADSAEAFAEVAYSALATSAASATHKNYSASATGSYSSHCSARNSDPCPYLAPA